MKTRILALALALFPLAGVVEGAAHAAPLVVVRREPRVWVASPPPAVVVEQRPAAPHPTAVWVPGYWHWNAHRYVWMKGHYTARREGYVWVEPRYEQRGRRWGYERGHWVRR